MDLRGSTREGIRRWATNQPIFSGACNHTEADMFENLMDHYFRACCVECSITQSRRGVGVQVCLSPKNWKRYGWAMARVLQYSVCPTDSFGYCRISGNSDLFRALLCEVIQRPFPVEVAFSEILHTLSSTSAKSHRYITQGTMYVWDHLIALSSIRGALLPLTRIGHIPGLYQYSTYSLTTPNSNSLPLLNCLLATYFYVAITTIISEAIGWG